MLKKGYTISAAENLLIYFFNVYNLYFLPIVMKFITYVKQVKI